MIQHKIAQRVAVALLTSIATAAMAAPGNSADELLHDADTALQQIDAGQYGALWDNAAPFIKAKFNRQQFTAQTQQAHQTVGAVYSRGWSSVVRLQYANDRDVPDGLYANVDYTSHLAGGQTVFELVSFRLEPDGQWHLTGYNVRGTPQIKTTIQQGTAQP